MEIIRGRKHSRMMPGLFPHLRENIRDLLYKIVKKLGARKIADL